MYWLAERLSTEAPGVIVVVQPYYFPVATALYIVSSPSASFVREQEIKLKEPIKATARNNFVIVFIFTILINKDCLYLTNIYAKPYNKRY